jgi:hypothetical protein
MKINHWTLALAAAGVVSMGAAAQAEEATESVKTLISDTTISGYVSTSATWRPGTGTAGLDLSSFGNSTAKADGFNLDVVDLTISKALDESEWAAGYTAELWFGPDIAGNATIPGATSVNIQQAYVALRAPIGNGIDMKMGVFNTILGYEANNATQNPNYTRSIAWGLQPTVHTGLLASYRFSDMVAVSGGVVEGLGPAINARQSAAGVSTSGSESRKGYTFGMEITAPDSWGFLSGSSLSGQILHTPNGAANPAAVNSASATTFLHMGATLNTPVEAWKVGLSYYYRANAPTATGGLAIANHNSSYASVWGLYNSYQVTEKLKLNVRAEYATGTAGTFIASTAANVGDDDPNQAFLGLTTTVDYSLWENVISRLEFRWDSSLTGGAAGGAGTDTPFGGTTGFVGANNTAADEKNAFLVALNVIYKF